MLRKLKEKLRMNLRRRLGVPDVTLSFERLAAAGFRPKLVFDAGAYEGEFVDTTRPIWREAEIVCFEVQPSPLARLQAKAAADGNVRVIPSLLGASPNPAVPLFLAETSSSLLSAQSVPNQKTQSFPMTTVDEVCSTILKGKTPDLLKLDVQGFELEVLKGAEASLSSIGAVLFESNFLALYDGVPLAHEIIAWLAERDFVLFDIAHQIRRPLDKALWQADLIMVPKSSNLRASTAWA